MLRGVLIALALVSSASARDPGRGGRGGRERRSGHGGYRGVTGGNRRTSNSVADDYQHPHRSSGGSNRRMAARYYYDDDIDEYESDVIGLSIPDNGAVIRGCNGPRRSCRIPAGLRSSYSQLSVLGPQIGSCAESLEHMSLMLKSGSGLDGVCETQRGVSSRCMAVAREMEEASQSMCGDHRDLGRRHDNGIVRLMDLLELTCAADPRHTTGSTATSPSRSACLREAIDRVVADLTSLATESDRLTSDFEGMDEAYVTHQMHSSPCSVCRAVSAYATGIDAFCDTMEDVASVDVPSSCDAGGSNSRRHSTHGGRDRARSVTERMDDRVVTPPPAAGGLDSAPYTQPFRVYEAFATEAECAELIQRYGNLTMQSRVVGANGESVLDSSARTSQSYYIPRADCPTIASIERKTMELLGVALDQIENLQIVRYEQGQQYKYHYDYFAHQMQSLAEQRATTVLLYLNTMKTEEGGATSFSIVGARVHPKAGRVLVFTNTYPDGSPNLDSLHAGEPVLGDTIKYALNIWVHHKAPTSPANIAHAGRVEL